MADLKPEAVYFCEDGGNRTIYLVVQLTDAHQFPAIAEPIWLGLGATAEFMPAMTPEDFAKAEPTIEALAKKY